MRIETVDLYAFYGLAKPAGRAGVLTCYIQTTSAEIAVGRTAPGVLILPGGGYSHTSPRESEAVALRFAAAGCHAFVLDYSVAPNRYPIALQEAVLAMRYLREHSGQWGLGGVAAMGFSAGGHLCGCLGTLFDSDEALRVSGGVTVRPEALVLCYPVAVSHGRTHEGSFENLTGGDEALRQKLSLDKLVRADMPPVFLWHTRDDGSVPVRNSLLLAVALEEQQVPFVMHIYGHGHHGLSTADIMSYPSMYLPEISRDVPEWVDKTMDFLKENGLEIVDRGGKKRE